MKLLYYVEDEETDNSSLYRIKGEDTEFQDTIEDLQLELVSPSSGPFYITTVSAGVWDLGVKGCKTINEPKISFFYRVRL